MRKMHPSIIVKGIMILPRSGYVLLGIFFFAQFTVCISGNKHHKSSVSLQNQLEDTSIVCYQCNSAYDPRCGDPFDPYTLGTVNCSMKKPLEHMKDFKPVLCRKTVQKVQGHTRVIRGCGYITDERDDKQCIRRTGTHDVILHYCSCTKSLCNGATSITNFTNIKVLISTAIIAFVLALSSFRSLIQQEES